MTFVTEKDGLKVEEFRKAVGNQIKADFPTWAPYIERISAMKTAS
jgi:hypothetical protein